MSVGDFLDGPVGEVPDGVDIMHNREAFHASEGPKIDDVVMGTPPEASHYNEGETRRTFALEATLQLMQQGYTTDDPIESANRLAEWLRTGTLPPAPPEDPQEGHSSAPEASDGPSSSTDGGPEEGASEPPRMGYDEGLTPADPA